MRWICREMLSHRLKSVQKYVVPVQSMHSFFSSWVLEPYSNLLVLKPRLGDLGCSFPNVDAYGSCVTVQITPFKKFATTCWPLQVSYSSPAYTEASLSRPLQFSSSATANLAFKIYTKTGDKGQSSLYDGQRRRKDDPTFEALGDVDELNSSLGLSHEYCLQSGLTSVAEQIEEIQSRLLDVGSAIATPLNSIVQAKVIKVKFDPEAVDVLETWIDKMDEELPPLKNFILPSGGFPAASLHMARSICRRAERKVVGLVAEGYTEATVTIYLNRLSDYLFTAARFTALKLDKPETIWRKEMIKA